MDDLSQSDHTFREGDYAMLVDRRERRYLLRLQASRLFESHIGIVAHQEIIGLPEGSWVTTGKGHHLLAVKPTMADFVREMPRIATVIYPKDLGQILVQGDIFPGARVLEAGAGSGALTIALVRAVGAEGQLVSYDVREDMLRRARQNVDAMIPGAQNVAFKLGDVYQGFEERDLDRMVLDLPEPWQVVPHAADALAPGGILLSFLPTILQVHDLTRALREARCFGMIETLELLMRPWSVGGRSVRPAQRMIGHTGFITTARRSSERPTASAQQPGEEQGETSSTE